LFGKKVHMSSFTALSGSTVGGTFSTFLAPYQSGLAKESYQHGFVVPMIYQRENRIG
jgi:hypothetical protein